MRPACSCGPATAPTGMGMCAPASCSPSCDTSALTTTPSWARAASSAAGRPQPLARARVIATLVYARPPLRDIDNAWASLKECIDALVTGGLIVDDGPGTIELLVRQELGVRRRLVLAVTPLD